MVGGYVTVSVPRVRAPNSDEEPLELHLEAESGIGQALVHKQAKVATGHGTRDFAVDKMLAQLVRHPPRPAFRALWRVIPPPIDIHLRTVFVLP